MTDRLRRAGASCAKRAAALAALVGAVATPAAAEIVPHEAHYRISLDSLRVEGTAMRAEGAMAIRATRDCEKWKVLKELLYVVALSDGTTIRIHTMDRVYEGLDGRRMEFAGWFRFNGGSRRDVKGHATLDPGSGRGTIRFSRPQAIEEPLPPGTQFPMSALRDTVDALGAGLPVRSRDVYSGLGLSVTTDVSPSTGRPKEPPRGNPELLDVRAWLIQSTVYADTGKAGRPIVTETTEMLENGVVSRFWSDFSMLAISGELVSVEEFPVPDC